MSSEVQPFFLDVGGHHAGRRFCIHHAPVSLPARGAVLYLHPFAEEMNKSRRMAALQSRALAGAGYAVLQIDLLGCGDSDGDFGDASWAGWLDDAIAGAAWLRNRYSAPLWLWGLRAGCLLAAEAAGRFDEPVHTIYWQPPPSGQLLLQQFLRLIVAGRMLDGASGDGGGVMAAARSTLAAGGTVEIAGYPLGAGLASGLGAARLTPPPHAASSLWLEVSTRAQTGPSPAIRAAADTWTAAGHQVIVANAVGPAFWQTQEIEDAPALVEATLSALHALSGETA